MESLLLRLRLSRLRTARYRLIQQRDLAPRLAVCYFAFYTGPPCEVPMPFSIRPFRRFPVQCSVTYNAGPFHGHRRIEQCRPSTP